MKDPVVQIFLIITIAIALSYTLLSYGSEDPVKETRERVFVIDTGLRITKKIKPYLCKRGHKSFVFGRGVFNDLRGHGTNIAGLIAKGMDPKKHCLVIVKFWAETSSSEAFQELANKSLKYALKNKASYVNLSFGGEDPNTFEKYYLKKLIESGAKITVSAGNENHNLDKDCNYYPACYRLNPKSFRIVGSSSEKVLSNGKRQKYSNYGNVVTHWEDGTDKGSPVLYGTSQATAINMAKWIKKSNTQKGGIK